ncbi:hypothetical protein AB0I35_09540 [Nocardia sp. NPDC050378]|uniref:DUF7373 family lipoprotein n=1 Tax=Nocardia sp. NPDC050378 TaxID=3155400 RepID=UPI0033D97130
MPADLSKLNMGSYTAEPYRYEFSSTAKAAELRRIESKRMLNYVISAADIDAEADELAGVETFKEPKDPFETPVFPDEFKPAIGDNTMVAGAYVARTDGNSRSPRRLIVSLLRFPTESAASKATTDLGRAIQEKSPQQIKINDMPDVTAYSSSWSAGTAVAARGVYLVMINYGRAAPDETAVTTNLSKAMNLQLTKIEGLVPMAWEDVLDSPVDPDGIMKKALASESPKYPFDDQGDFGAYTPTAHLHYERNLPQVGKAYTASGVDLVGRRAGIVYRTRDLEGAFQLQVALTSLGKRDHETPAPSLMADARCVQLYEKDPVRNYDLLCAVVKGRWVGVVTARSKLSGQVDPVLYERAAAQYALLATTE